MTLLGRATVVGLGSVVALLAGVGGWIAHEKDQARGFVEQIHVGAALPDVVAATMARAGADATYWVECSEPGAPGTSLRPPIAGRLVWRAQRVNDRLDLTRRETDGRSSRESFRSVEEWIRSVGALSVTDCGAVVVGIGSRLSVEVAFDAAGRVRKVSHAVVGD